MTLEPLRPGDDVRGIRERFNALLRAVTAAGKTWVGDGLEKVGRAVRHDRIEPFWVKITGGVNPYSWAEVTPDGAGGFAPLAGGRSGTLNAYEYNGIAIVY